MMQYLHARPVPKIKISYCLNNVYLFDVKVEQTTFIYLTMFCLSFPELVSLITNNKMNGLLFL
jgi:hypothetical protein